MSPDRRPLLQRAEVTAACLLTVVVLVLLCLRATHAGALWRDECAVVQLARSADLADVFRHSESFPVPFLFLVRAGGSLVGTSDAAWRAVGFLTGVLLVAALWFHARLTGSQVPLLSLALLGLNTAMLTWATTIRGYGPGCVFLLVAFSLLTKALLEPTRRRLGAALLAAIVCVQFLFFNLVLLAAIGGAAAVVMVLRRNIRGAAALLGIVALAAVSLLPNLGALSASRQWAPLLQQPPDLLEMWGQLDTTLGAPLPALAWVWYLLLGGVTVVAVRRLLELPASDPSPERERLLFGVLTIGLSLLGYLLFLSALRYPSRPWYFLALLTVLAVTIEWLAADLLKDTRLRLARLGLVVAALLILPAAAWPQLKLRLTNLDAVAQKLQQASRPGDLIVLNPWYYGIAFHWHYRGPTPWVTVPLLADHRFHRYDLVKEKMLSPRPLDDLTTRLTETLQAGGCVWLVGQPVSAGPGQRPVELAPAPDSPYGWDSRYYAGSWSQQVVFFLEQHAAQREPVDVPTPGTVGNLENAVVLRLQGWRTPAEPESTTPSQP